MSDASTTWWKSQPTTAFGTTTGVRLSTGAVDVEKGAILGVPAGQDISLPEKTKLVWADSQHAVLQDQAGDFINLLHVNTYAQVGSVIEANHPFARVSNVVGSVSDTTSGETYFESGNIVELGLYTTEQGAVSRENIVGGVDQPYNFNGIINPSQMLADWSKGTFNKSYAGNAGTDLTTTFSGSTGAAGGGGELGILDFNPFDYMPGGTSSPLPTWLLMAVLVGVLAFAFHKR